MMEELNMKRIQAENDYLKYKIDKYTNMLITTDFQKNEKSLIERHVAKMLDRKIMNEKIIESVKK